MMRIVPALLAHTGHELKTMLKQAESFCDYVQIDVMDGVFVPVLSFPQEELNNLATTLSYELHLMTENPAGFMTGITPDPGLKKVIFHCEAAVNHRDFFGDMRRRKFRAGLAINPETTLKEYRDLAAYADTLLFLTVDPCCYGNPFKPEVLDKVSESRRLFPHKEIGVDGGVSLENLALLHACGADYACVGSRIFRSGNPADNYGQFLDTVRRFE